MKTHRLSVVRFYRSEHNFKEKEIMWSFQNLKNEQNTTSHEQQTLYATWGPWLHIRIADRLTDRQKSRSFGSLLVWSLQMCVITKPRWKDIISVLREAIVVVYWSGLCHFHTVLSIQRCGDRNYSQENNIQDSCWFSSGKSVPASSPQDGAISHQSLPTIQKGLNVQSAQSILSTPYPRLGKC